MFKGRNTGDISPNLGVRGNAVSPCNIQDGVTPDFALNPGAGCEENDNEFSDKNDMTTASSAEQVEEAVWFSCLCKKMFLLMIPFEVKYYVEMCNIIFSKKSSV